jgi:hypothetical protein
MAIQTRSILKKGGDQKGNQMKKIPAVFYLILLIHQAFAQDASIYPLPTLRLSDNFITDNPAAGFISNASDLRFITGYYTGLAGRVGLNLLDANFRVESSKTSVHVPGILIHSEYETEILKRSRVYFRYSYNTKISSDARLSAGILAGFFNYFVKASGSSAGMSVFVPDATAGLCMQGKKYIIGIAAAQVFNSIVRPVNSAYSLKRYFSFNGDYRLVSGAFCDIHAGIRWIAPAGKFNAINPGVKVILMKNFSAEFNYAFNKGFAVSAGIVRFPVLTQKADLNLSYFSTTGQENFLNVNRLELALRIYFREKQKGEEHTQSEE